MRKLEFRNTGLKHAVWQSSLYPITIWQFQATKQRNSGLNTDEKCKVPCGLAICRRMLHPVPTYTRSTYFLDLMPQALFFQTWPGGAGVYLTPAVYTLFLSDIYIFPLQLQLFIPHINTWGVYLQLNLGNPAFKRKNTVWPKKRALCVSSKMQRLLWR